MKVLRNHPSNTSNPEPRISYRVASTPRELEQAFRLVYQAYVRVGLAPERAQAIRLTKYHLWPATRVFIAVEHTGFGSSRVVGTLSVMADGALGLPSDTVAAGDIRALRSAGGGTAEMGALASDETGRRNRVTLKLFHLAFEFCRASGISTILAALTRRHIGFYRRFVGFQPLGNIRACAFGNGMPVQVHVLHVERALGVVLQRAAALQRDGDWRHFMATGLAESVDKAREIRPWPAAVVTYFIHRDGELGRQLDRHTIEQFQSEYRKYGVRFPIPAGSAHDEGMAERPARRVFPFPVVLDLAMACSSN